MDVLYHDNAHIILLLLCYNNIPINLSRITEWEGFKHVKLCSFKPEGKQWNSRRGFVRVKYSQ